MTAPANDGLLVAPHRFPDLSGEERLAAAFDVPLLAAGDPQEFERLLPEAQILLITPYVTVDAPAIAQASSCRAIVRYGAGVDNIDIEAATAAGIPVANVPDASVEEVALHAVAMLTALVRRLPAGERALREGDWRTNVMAGVRRFSTLTVGVVGLGRIGARTADHLAALGARVIGHDPDRVVPGITPASLDEVLTSSDAVSLHVPLTEGTAGLISRERLAAMKPGAILVNVSRGGLLDEVAVAEALVAGTLGGAGIDVFATEPLPLGHPLLEAPNTILTPHLAWRATESAMDYQRKALEQAALALEGRRMTALVNPTVHDHDPLRRD